MIIPWHHLAADTLNSLLEEYAAREGTDYGEHEYSMPDKVAQLKQQLHQGHIVIVFSEAYESVDLRLAEDYPNYQSQPSNPPTD